MSEPTTRILDLSDYWHMVKVRKWTVLVVAVIVAAASVGYTLLKPAVYHAQATVQVNQIANPLTGGKSNSSSAPDMPTEAAIAKSYTIAQLVQQQLKLTATPQQLAKGVTVTVGRSGNIMTIGYTAKTPEQAAAVANAFAQNYLSQRKSTVTDDIQQAVSTYTALVKSTQGKLTTLRDELGRAGSTIEQHNFLNQIDSASADLSNYQGRIADLESEAAIDANSVGNITQGAFAPAAPTGPALPLAIAIGLVIGFLMGAALAIILGLRANRVGGRDELAIHLGAPVMAVIPKVDGWDKADEAELVTREEPSAPASEAYRTLATNIRFYRSQQPLRVLVVTSALPSEGKSATAANLAVVLAETGLRTVLVDADLRRPRASRFLGVGDHAGLHEALDGSRDLVDVIQATDIENLWIVGAGTVPRDPVALLAGPNAANVFDGLRRVADVVVCDAPPILPVADASVIAEASDAVLFVHDPSISNRTALEDAVKQLRTAGGAIIGGVYNNVSAAQRSYLGYASYDSYYGQDRRNRKKAAALTAAAAQGASSNGSATKGSTSRVSGLD